MATKPMGKKTTTNAVSTKRVKAPVASPRTVAGAKKSAGSAKPAIGAAKTIPAPRKPAGAKTISAAAGTPRKRLSRPELRARKEAAASGAGGATATTTGEPPRRAKAGTAMGLATGKGAA